jgi:hypothetical protein
VPDLTADSSAWQMARPREMSSSYGPCPRPTDLMHISSIITPRLHLSRGALSSSRVVATVDMVSGAAYGHVNATAVVEVVDLVYC